MIPEIPTTRDMINVFGGYNGNLVIGDNEFADMRNMTSSYYPVVSPRGPRASLKNLGFVTGLHAKNGISYCQGPQFCYNGKAVPGITLSGTGKQMVSMGAYILIFPDKIWFNTENGEWGYMEQSNTPTSSTVAANYYPCTKDGERMEYPWTEPETPVNGEIWLDRSETPHRLMKWSETTAQWVQVATTYIAISGTGVGVGISEGDAITISNARANGGWGNDYETMGKFLEEQIAAINGTAIVQSRSDDHIVIIGMLDAICEQYSMGPTISRTIPQMEYIIEANNRLWGCHYGIVDGRTVNEIYASALGDFKNWRKYEGIASDSYAVSLGSDGPFTGAITYLGHPIFFKENYIHKVFGSMPSNFQLVTTNCRGVQSGCARSLAIIDDILYYKSSVDICAYDGSLPVSVSSAITEKYRNAVACGLNGKYYISMTSKKEDALFVYDSKRGMWHKEDNTQFKFAVTYDTDMYFISNGILYSLNGGNPFDDVEPTYEEPVDWMIETGDIGMTSPDHKYISRINIRLKTDGDIGIYTMYDSDGIWEDKGKISATIKNSFVIPIIPRRCDHMRIRLVGKGDAKIYSISKISEQGSDIL
jgi:hypothetical protein